MSTWARVRVAIAVVFVAAVAALVMRPFSDAEDAVSVLFVGNSYTTTNDLPGTFAAFAAAGGHRVETEVVAWGGAWLRDHVDQGHAANALREGDRDFIVIQEQSVVPSSADHRVAAMYPAIRQLVATAQREGTVPVLFLTWGRRDGFPEVGHFSYESMQLAITRAYEEIASEVGARVAPVGEAWSSMQDAGTRLFAADGSHPAPAGTYLAAAVLYGSLFGEDPIEVAYSGGLDELTALRLRSAAAVRTLGDRDRWHIPHPETLPSS